jgi:GlcNAc-P-P-Und epimerase
MRCLVSGGSGFLGRHVVSHLRSEGNEVSVLGRSPGSEVVADLGSGIPTLPPAGYDIAFHIAGKAHVVPLTEADRESFFDVNARGTSNLLSALERQATVPGAFVLVSTVGVYGQEAGEGLTEETSHAATDPYGVSKSQAEESVLKWGAQHGVRVGIVRLPLVAGPGAPGNLGAMVQGIRTGRYLGIGDGSARRSVVLAPDVARILPVVAERGGTYNLTDGHHPTFAEIERAIARVLGKSPPRHLPELVAKMGARVGDAVLKTTGVRLPLTSRPLTKMTSTLTFDDSKARQELGWNPRAVVDHAEEWVR